MVNGSSGISEDSENTPPVRNRARRELLNGKVAAAARPTNTAVRERRKRVVRTPISTDNSSDGSKTRAITAMERPKPRISRQSSKESKESKEESKESSSDNSEEDVPLVASTRSWGAPWASSETNGTSNYINFFS